MEKHGRNKGEDRTSQSQDALRGKRKPKHHSQHRKYKMVRRDQEQRQHLIAWLWRCQNVIEDQRCCFPLFSLLIFKNVNKNTKRGGFTWEGYRGLCLGNLNMVIFVFIESIWKIIEEKLSKPLSFITMFPTK